MFSLNEKHHYYIYEEPTDMRKGFDGLSGLVRKELGQNPLSGDVYIFIHKGRNRMILLVWEQGGFVLYYKRLEQVRFELPIKDRSGNSRSISWQKLLLIVKGIELTSIRKRKRFSLQKTG